MSSAQFDYLVQQLNHSLPTIRFNAVRALGEHHSSEVVEILLVVMNNDMSSGVRDAARTVLDDFGYLPQQ